MQVCGRLFWDVYTCVCVCGSVVKEFQGLERTLAEGLREMTEQL